LGRAGGLKLYILNKMKDTNLNGKKNNMYYQTIFNKNTLKNINIFKVRLSYSNQLHKKDSLLFPYRLGLFQILSPISKIASAKCSPAIKDGRKYYHNSNIRAVNRIGTHNEDVLSVIIGSLLGDASSLYIKKKISSLIKITLNPN
jgi:hypothetical protein